MKINYQEQILGQVHTGLPLQTRIDRVIGMGEDELTSHGLSTIENTVENQYAGFSYGDANIFLRRTILDKGIIPAPVAICVESDGEVDSIRKVMEGLLSRGAMQIRLKEEN